LKLMGTTKLTPDRNHRKPGKTKQEIVVLNHVICIKWSSGQCC
jgi:hypothetical protein